MGLVKKREQGHDVAGRILQEDIEHLKRSADLADVISDHTRLQRAGSRLKGLCPFHQERTPSFTVDPDKGVYHCFGCGEGGDVFTFLQRAEGLTFTEAVEQLARRLGHELRYEQLSAGQRRALGERTRLVGACRAACEFFRHQLHGEAGASARQYVVRRGFDREEAARFLLGFAPLTSDALTRHLLTTGFGEREIEGAGLASRGAGGRLRDRFRGRLMFPILDASGDAIAFGGRVVPDLDYGEQDPPKYLNSPETALYRKRDTLYGMSWARPEIVRSGEVLVAEGYTDVMALHQGGFTNAVATCGTAVGAEHLRLLERYAERVVLAFDADEAGGKAAERAWELSQMHGVDLRVLVLPKGSDPADVVHEGGAGAMRELVATSEPVVRFMLRRSITEHDHTPEGRSAAVEAAAALLAQIDDIVLRDQYSRWVANDLVGVALGVVALAVERAGGDLPAVTARRTEEPPAVDRREASARARLEREILRVTLQSPDVLPAQWAEVDEADFTHPRAREVFRLIKAVGGAGAEVTAVLEAAPDDELRALVRAIALEDCTIEPDKVHAAMLVGRLLLNRLERAITARKRQLERMNPVADPDAYRQRFEELIGLEARRRELRALANG
ncbi:MAG: DNA primase [Nitriliruptorales bacterium]